MYFLFDMQANKKQAQNYGCLVEKEDSHEVLLKPCMVIQLQYLMSKQIS